jgi:hypothetical protein
MALVHEYELTLQRPQPEAVGGYSGETVHSRWVETLARAL